MGIKVFNICMKIIIFIEMIMPNNLFHIPYANSILQEPLSDSSGSGSCVSFESFLNFRISSNVTVSCVLFSVRKITTWSSHRITSFTNVWIT